MWHCIILLDVFNSRDVFKEGNDFGLHHFTDVSVAIEINLNSDQLVSFMIRNCSPDHHTGCSATMSFDNALWKAVLTGIASNRNTAIIVQQIYSSEKRTRMPTDVTGSVHMSPLQKRPSMVFCEGGSCIKLALNSVHGPADDDEFKMLTLVHL